jgi:DNA-directed RNA polymerase specialized sigma24 family protein
MSSEITTQGRASQSYTGTFATTHWTRVLAARGDSSEAQAALSELCAAYYQPVVAFLSGNGRTDDAARELAHQFFSRILERNGLDGADPERGRFRSYLLGALKHFLHATREREERQKRGGAHEHVALRPTTDTSPGVDPAAPISLAPDEAFDRQWAMTVLERALTAVERGVGAAGDGHEFEVLKPWLTGDCHGHSQTQADAARRLNMSEGAVKVAIHRLRKRFREAVRQEIASTLNRSADLPNELEHLLAVLRR